MLEGKLSIFFINFETGLSDTPNDRKNMDMMRSIDRIFLGFGGSWGPREMDELVRIWIQIHHMGNALRDELVRRKIINL